MVHYGAPCTDRYVVNTIERFDQKNEMFKRPLWDDSLQELGKQFYGLQYPKDQKPGYDLLSQAFKNASYYVDIGFAHGMFGGRWGLYAWESKPWGENPQPKELQLRVDHPDAMSSVIKQAARFYGASTVGISNMDRGWLYSYHYYPKPYLVNINYLL